MTVSDSDPEFTRRKFTIPETLDSELQTIADRHYQGNVSLCLRQAIQDHRATLQGEGRTTLKQVHAEVTSLQTVADELLDTIEEIATGAERPQPRVSTMAAFPTFHSTTEPQQRICQELVNSNHPLRVDDLIERVELPPQEVQAVIGELLDFGIIQATDTSPPRYRLPSMVPDQSNHTK